jgi:DNA-binding NtrC family response regulator
MTSINGKSILVIDDNAAMLRALKKVLSSEGGVVSIASWVGEVMERLTDKQGCFDLIITDLRMPVLGGQSILGAVKAALPEVPVIVITAFGSPELQAECLEKGAAAFLEKPLDTPQLLAAIDRVFLTRRPRGKRGGRRERRLWKPKASASGNQTLPRLACPPSLSQICAVERAI